MTNESNKNLLKVLINDPEEQPGEDKGIFIDVGNNNMTSPNVGLQQVSYGSYTIFITGGGTITMYGENDTVLINQAIPSYNDKTYEIDAICIDSSGYLYGTGYITGTANMQLLYFGYITVPDGDGNYTLRVNKVYNLNTAISEIQTATGFNAFMGTALIKCPLDSRFLIVISGERYNSNQYNFLYIVYHVNFEGENTYEYKIGNLSDYLYAFVEGTYASWTDSNVNIMSIFRNVANFGVDTPQTAKYYKVTLDFTEGTAITKTLIDTVNNTIVGSYRNSGNGLAVGLNTAYIPIVQKDANNYITVSIYKYDGTMKLMYYLGASDTNASSKAYIDFVEANNEVFAGVRTTISSYPSDWKFQAYVVHFTSNGAEAFNYGELGFNIDGFYVHNAYNYYKITFQRHTGIYIYRSVGYNGEPYFSNESVTPAYTILYSNDTNTNLPIFSRDLYNITKVGNTLNSITQVPFNLLNDKNISEIKLLSKTAETIDDTVKEINKNIYEELYINNINSYRVYNNNVGSTYNQESSLKIVDGILTSFDNNYKITKYRINFEDNTYTDRVIENITRTDNIAKIYMYVYLTKKAKNIQLYDDSFTVPFLTIDASNLDIEKIYKLEQKLKVE